MIRQITLIIISNGHTVTNLLHKGYSGITHYFAILLT